MKNLYLLIVLSFFIGCADEEEKSQLLGNIKDTVEELQDKSDFLSTELDDITSKDITKRLGK